MVQARDRVSGLFERVSVAHSLGVRWRVLIAIPLSQRHERGKRHLQRWLPRTSVQQVQHSLRIQLASPTRLRTILTSRWRNLLWSPKYFWNRCDRRELNPEMLGTHGIFPLF